MMTSPSSRPRTPADVVRAAAIAARQAKEPKGDGIDVFLVRSADGKTFSWEIRRYGGIVLVDSQETFATQAEARAAGRQGLAHHRESSLKAAEK